MAHVENEIASLFNSQRFADVVIYCGDRKWYAHKFIICTQSEFFQKACEREFKEAETGRITLEDDDPQIVDALLMYLYTGNYNQVIVIESSSGPFCRPRPLFHVQVFALAEKYFVEKLLNIAASKFSISLQRTCDEDDFAEAIEEWAAGTTDSRKILGAKIVNEVIGRKAELLDPEKQSSRFRKVMNETPWFAAEIAQMLYSHSQDDSGMKLYRCPRNDVLLNRCNGVFKAKIDGNDGFFAMSCRECGNYNNHLKTFWRSCVIEPTVVEDERGRTSSPIFLVD